MSAIRKLDVLIGASTEGLSKGFKKAEQMTTAFNAKVSKFVAGPGGIGGAIAGALGGVTVAAGLKYAVGQYSQLQEAQTKLQTAFKSTNGVAGLSVGQVSSYATQLSQTTRFAASATIEAAAGLAKFQLVKGGNFTAAIKQAQNFATVMGKDLPGAASELGAALNNPKAGWMQLAAVGVMFSDAQIEAINSMTAANDVAGAQGVILDALATQFDGAAEAAGSTLAGKLDILHNSFSNIAAVVGEAVAPAVSAAVDQMVDWLNSLDANQVKATSWNVMAKSVGFVADMVQTLNLAWKGAKVVTDWVLVGAVTLVQKLIAGIEAAYNWLAKLAGMEQKSLGAKSIEEFRQGLIEVTRKDKTDFGKAWIAPDASTKVEQFFRTAKDKGEQAMNSIASAADKTGDKIAAGLGKGAKAFSAEMLDLEKQIQQMTRDIQFFGMDDRQKKIAEMQDKGGLNDPAQVEKAKKLAFQLRGKEIEQENERPIEKFFREMSKLKDVKDAGGINQGVFDRAKAKLVQDLQNSIPEGKASAGGAMQRTSVEARSAILNYRNASQRANPVLALQKAAQAQLQVEQDSNKWIRLLAQNQPAIAAFAGL